MLPDRHRTSLPSAPDRLELQIRSLEAEIVQQAGENEVLRRLMTILEVGALIATALVAWAPPPWAFRRGRDFAAWLGLTLEQHSTGGKQRPGVTTRMGERSLRRLLIIGSDSVIKRHVHKAPRPSTWLRGLLSRKSPMLMRMALVKKMARVVWTPLAKG